MSIPVNILSIIQRINESEDLWKATYMAIHPYSAYIEKTFNWDGKLKLGLPQSKNKSHDYTPRQLHTILITMDDNLTLGHLVTLFSLFEELKVAIQSSSLKIELSDVIKSHSDELWLAKETRNRYVHTNWKINDTWRKAYKAARNIHSAHADGTDLREVFRDPALFQQVETWHELIVDIANKIKVKIEEK